MSDFGRSSDCVKHLWIDLDSANHPEVMLHVFRQQRFDFEINAQSEKLFVVIEHGFGQEPEMRHLTRKEFQDTFFIDVPELFST